MDKITSFSGEYRWLSNFNQWSVMAEFGYPKSYNSWHSIPAGGRRVAPTIEHAYQATKAASLDDFRMIIDLETAGQAKRAGAKVKMRDDWEDVKLDVMAYYIAQKYMAMGDLNDPNLPANKLVATGDAELIEGNTWGDTFWGQCPLGVGENHLGKILMRQRDLLRGKF